MFWLNDEQWTKIEPLIPTNRPARSRRIIDGFSAESFMCSTPVSLAGWQDCPSEYGAYRTVYNRFNRWSGCGIWQQTFETMAGSPEPPKRAALGSTHVIARRCAGGGNVCPPRQVVLHCWREQVCIAVSGLSAAPRPRWRSARSSPHKGRHQVCHFPGFLNAGSLSDQSTAQPPADVGDRPPAGALVDLFE